MKDTPNRSPRQRLCPGGFHFCGNALCPVGMEIVDDNSTRAVFRQIQRDLTAHALTGPGHESGAFLDGKQFTHFSSLPIPAISCGGDNV